MDVDDACAQAQGIELACGRMRCMLQPLLGGCVAGLWYDGVPVLRSRPMVQSARDSANFPLVPFSNRIAQAALHWGSHRYALRRNFDPEPHAMHGIGWQRAWAVAASDARRATLILEHTANEDWPFGFRCEQVFELDADALRVSLAFTNTAPIPAPVGLGWHPYVVKRPGAVLRFMAQGRWETDSHSLPVARVECGGLEAACGTLSVNHAYEGWHGPATLEDNLLRVAISSDLPRLIASTNPSKDFVALEPVSHVPDSFNHGDTARGTIVLAPGETVRAHMAIQAGSVA